MDLDSDDEDLFAEPATQLYGTVSNDDDEDIQSTQMNPTYAYRLDIFGDRRILASCKDVAKVVKQSREKTEMGRKQLLKLAEEHKSVVSRNHFEIQHQNKNGKNTFWLVNKSQTNGTALNTRKITEVDKPQQLSDGDKIGIIFKSSDKGIEEIELGWTFRALIDIENRKDRDTPYIFKAPAKTPVQKSPATAKKTAATKEKGLPKDPLTFLTTALSNPEVRNLVQQKLTKTLSKEEVIEPETETVSKKRKAEETKKQEKEQTQDTESTKKAKVGEPFAKDKKIAALGYNEDINKDPRKVKIIQYLEKNGASFNSLASAKSDIIVLHRDYLYNPSTQLVDFLACKENHNVQFIENFSALDKCCAEKSLSKLEKYEILPRRSAGQIILDSDMIKDEAREVLSETLALLQPELTLGFMWKIRVEVDLIEKIGAWKNESSDRRLKEKAEKSSHVFKTNAGRFELLSPVTDPSQWMKPHVS